MRVASRILLGRLLLDEVSFDLIAVNAAAIGAS
jgi:hypothetical protein